MTTNYGGMTPWEYNNWANSRVTTSTSTSGSSGEDTSGPYVMRNGVRVYAGTGSTQGGGSTGPGTDPYEGIDRSPFSLGENDAIALAQQQRVRDATSYRYNLAGLPQPIELWSGNVADTQRTTPMGTVASLMPGTGAFAPAESYRNYALAREAYMNDAIRLAQEAARDGSTPEDGAGRETPGGNTSPPPAGERSPRTTTSTSTSTTSRTPRTIWNP